MKYSALTWVKATIDESLKQTRQALEQFVENPSDTAPLQQCVLWLHEIYGALKLLELQSAALLVEELELTIKTLLTGKVQSNETTYDTLMRALVQLPNYLDHLWIVQRDLPMALTSLLNSLRSLRGQTAINPSQLFMPDLSVVIPVPKVQKMPDDKLKEYMQKMRAAFQKGLTNIVKDPKQAEEGLKFVYQVMQRLQQVTGSAPISKVWWVSEGVLEAVLQKGLELNNSLLNSLKQIDALIKQFVDHGNAAMNLAPPKPVLTNLLLLAGHARSKGKVITEVKNVFKLTDSFPGEAALANARLIFAGPDIELMKVVVTLLKDDFARLEETLDIFNRADNPSVSELSPLVGLLGDMASTLSLLGLTAQTKNMLQQRKVIIEITEGRKSHELNILLEIATALLKISGAIDILGVQGVHARQRLQESADTQFWETPQFGVVMGVVVDEAKQELAQVIQPLVNFIDTKSQEDALLEVPNRLKQVVGFLRIAAHDRAAKLLTHCTRYIEKVFIKESTVPPLEKQKALADVLISLEFYLDTLAGSPLDAQDILDVTERRLKVMLAA